MPDLRDITNPLLLKMARPSYIKGTGHNLLVGGTYYPDQHPVKRVYRKVTASYLRKIKASQNQHDALLVVPALFAMCSFSMLVSSVLVMSLLWSLVFWQLFLFSSVIVYAIWKRHEENLTYLGTAYYHELDVDLRLFIDPDAQEEQGVEALATIGDEVC